MQMIAIDAYVDPLERPAVISGAEQMIDALHDLLPEGAQPIQINFCAPGSDDSNPFLDVTPKIILMSLLAELEKPPENLLVSRKSWVIRLEKLQEQSEEIFICNIFRHVDLGINRNANHLLRERIRRLNLLALELSQTHGVGVIDIDRAMAHSGGRMLASDYRLGSQAALDVAGHTIAWTLFNFGLDHYLEPIYQDKAKSNLGDIYQLHERIQRRQVRVNQEEGWHG